MAAPNNIENPGAPGETGAQGPQGMSAAGVQGPQGSVAGAIGSQSNHMAGVAFSTLATNYLFSATPGAGDWMFWFAMQFSDAAGGNTSSMSVTVNGVPIPLYLIGVTPAPPATEKLTFIGKVALGPADVLAVEGSPPGSPGFSMDFGYYGLLKVG